MTPDRPHVLLMTSVEATYNREILSGVVAYAHEHTDWKLVCMESSSAKVLQRMRPAGLLVTGIDQYPVIWARREGVPLVFIGSAVHRPQSTRVSVDDDHIGAMAEEHLSGLGFKHLAYVGRGPWPFVRARCDAFMAAAKRRGCVSMHQLISPTHRPAQHHRFVTQLQKLLRKLPRPCGLFAMNDLLGMLVIESCHNLGLRVPDDVAVLGVDNDLLACELSEVPLSSITQPAFALGTEAARVLHKCMRQPGEPLADVTLQPSRVVTRASTDLIALADEDVVAALGLINHHFTEPINVEWVVTRVAVARRTLFRKFKTLVGRTILEHIHHVRFQTAKELLTDVNLGMDQVAKRSGFVSARWMAESFRRRLKITPVQFRNQFRQKLIADRNPGDSSPEP